MTGQAFLRIPAHVAERLEALLRCRYPNAEWMTFFRFGWSLHEGTMTFSITTLDEPLPGELDETVRHVRIQEPYSLRAVLAADQDRLGLGVIHSHPQDCAPLPSTTDDDMDAYYGDYFGSFLGERPYLSLIYSSAQAGERSFSGRAWFRGRAYSIGKVTLVGDKLEMFWPRPPPAAPPSVAARTKRAVDMYGAQAMRRLWNSSVAVVGAGGTGSAAAHVLARAGVGSLVLIDSDKLDATNIERVHGSYASHAAEHPLKVKLARDLARRICPEMKITAISGNCLQPLARSHLLRVDLILSCTDTGHSRVGLAELAYRYGVPVIDVAVQLGGKAGGVTSETIQFVRYAPGLPCPYCRCLINTWRVSVELMSQEERKRRRQQAAAAVERGEPADPYWQGEPPQILTMGHLTTTAGAMAAAYGLGMLSGTAAMPTAFFQIDILKDGFAYVPVTMDPSPGCACADVQCHADQAADRAAISAPAHWPEAELVGD